MPQSPALLMEDNFTGNPGDTFSADTFFTANIGLPMVASHYGVGVQIPAATIGYLSRTFTAATAQVFSRIYTLSAIPTAVATIFQVRTSSAGIATARIQPTTGTLSLSNAASGTILRQSTGAVPIATEFRVVYVVSGTSFSATVYPDISSTTALYTLAAVTITGGSMTISRDGDADTGGIVGATLTIAYPIDHTTDPGLRQWSWVTIDNASGIVPKLVTATVHQENITATKNYLVNWGDGTIDGPQTSVTFTHTYTTTGSKSITPTVRA